MKQFIKGYLFDGISQKIDTEIFDALVKRPGMSIHRILTQGQTTDWLEQDTEEWVILLAGSAKLLIEEGNREVSMKPGDYLNIPAGCRHRVSWTDPGQTSVWLAVHYKS